MKICPPACPLLTALIHADIVLARIHLALEQLGLDTTILETGCATVITNYLELPEIKANTLLEYYILLRQEAAHSTVDAGREAAVITGKLKTMP